MERMVMMMAVAVEDDDGNSTYAIEHEFSRRISARIILSLWPALI